jgi:hypothetical protein
VTVIGANMLSSAVWGYESGFTRLTWVEEVERQTQMDAEERRRPQKGPKSGDK